MRPDPKYHWVQPRLSRFKLGHRPTFASIAAAGWQARVYCTRCKGFRRVEIPASHAGQVFAGLRYRCPGCRGPVSTSYGGGGMASYTEGYTNGQPWLR
jgi:hypothetical protein